ncbi:ferredoxin [Plantactinospora sp. WMMC1484]|uniref:ferredoxin n=1 Tax=Plantactinospora sp. WMMC1484 TaxID=3404122 RepID=UPI003BF4648F
MRITADYDRCEAHGECVKAVPEAFEIRDDDMMYILQERPPEQLRQRLESAVIRCPMQALSLQD